MIKFLTSLSLCAVAVLALNARAEDDGEELVINASVDLAKGVCADPNMTDDDRAEMIAQSPEDAVKCMGREWVYGDRQQIETSSLGQLDVDANVSANRIRVTDRDGGLHVMLTSPGLPGRTTETLTGNFLGPFRVEGRDYKVKNTDVDYTGAPMPFATFYNPFGRAGENGYAIHGTYAVGQLGRPASHGCLRVRIADAKFINEQVREANDSSASIRVYGRVASGAVRMRSQPPRAPRREYPPQDPYGFPEGL